MAPHAVGDDVHVEFGEENEAILVVIAFLPDVGNACRYGSHCIQLQLALSADTREPAYVKQSTRSPDACKGWLARTSLAVGRCQRPPDSLAKLRGMRHRSEHATMTLTLGIITDLHFGPRANFGGKLRKLSHCAGDLTAAFSREMRDEVKPDLVVNLGDVVEDECNEADRARYAECMRVLAEAGSERLDIAGNHDVVHLSRTELRAFWGLDDGPLYRSLDRQGVHLVTLATHETKDVAVTIDDVQLDWLAADLAATSRPTVILMHHSAADQDLTGNRWFAKAPHLALVKSRKRLRSILESSGKVVLVLNGHLHWNHLDVIHGIPYVTVQSLIENLDDDAPGRAAAAYAVARITSRRISIDVRGAESCRYQFELPASPSGDVDEEVSNVHVPPS